MSSQDSRKDPRSKILNLTVRYKSATVAEFVEDYSYDISRGGLFIKTANPFPTGTLLKFEVRIGEEQKVIDGVGRVTWRRERPQGTGKPAGMGIKFIRIADECVQLIQNAVDQHTGAEGQFEEGAREQGVFLSEPPANLRSSGTANNESHSTAVPRMFPDNQSAPGSELDDPSDQSMLFQSTELLKTAMSKVTPLEAAEPRPSEQRYGDSHSPVEDRVTLPTGASRIPPTTGAPPETRSEAVTHSAVSHETPSEDDTAPDSSEEVTRQFVPDEHHPVLAAQSPRSKSPARRKNPKKKKKKFNYTSLPAPKQSKPPVGAMTEAAPTAPPRANDDSKIRPVSAAPARSFKGWLVALGLLAVGAAAFIALTTRKNDEAKLDRDPMTPPQSAVATAKPVSVETPPTPLTSLGQLPELTAVSPTTDVTPSPSVSVNSPTTAAVNEPENPAPSPGDEAPKETANEGAPESATSHAVEEADPAPAKPRPRTRRRVTKKPSPENTSAPEVNAVVPPPAAPAPLPPPLNGASEASVKPGDVNPAPEPRPAPSPAPAPAPAPPPAPAPTPVPPAPVPPPPAPPAPVPPAPAPPTPAPPIPAQ